MVLLYGDFSISSGIKTIQNSLTSLQNTFTEVNSTVSSLNSYGSSLSSYVVELKGFIPSQTTSSNCFFSNFFFIIWNDLNTILECQLPSQVYSTFMNYLSEYESDTKGFLQYSGPILNSFGTLLKTDIPLYAVYYRNILLYALWSLALACIIIIVPSHIFKSKG